VTRRGKIILGVLGSAFLVLFIYIGYLWFSTARDAELRIQKGIIKEVIFSESPVYYDDGITPIGVFFEKTHRKYVSYDEVPKIFIKALIAAEDKNFFSHPGFDLKAIARALLANIKAGRIVQGGSTITQQTAKNVFKRQKRSYGAKLRELMQAVLLEMRYTKEEILEMYINQFFVTGIGKGLGIAAEYFFNKKVEDLNLVESAFIAGAIQAPNRYNPFIKRSWVEKERVRRLAKARKDYVLRNMYRLQFITKEQYEEAKAKEVPFKKGKIAFRLNVVLDYVREQLESDYFRNILEEQGITNIATSGIKIYTSVNKELQEKVLEALRSHLSYMDVLLNGYPWGRLGQAPGGPQLLPGPDRTDENLPFLAKITQIRITKDQVQVVVSWDTGGGIIDKRGLSKIVDAWVKWKKGMWATPTQKDYISFLKRFAIGDLLRVRFVKNNSESGRELVLTTLPKLQGAVVVLHGGMIKAMIGGYHNKFFNRVVDAKRQLGSIFKPFVYTAALQLGWNTLDELPNRRELYRYQSTSYVPRPDHPPKSSKVSIAWAGVKSENLATVWLLYHLTDQLTIGQFRQLAELVGLGQRPDESYDEYVHRIRDTHGVLVNRAALMEAAFEMAKRGIESDLIFEDQVDAVDNLSRIRYDSSGHGLSHEDLEEWDILRYDFQRLIRLDKRMRATVKRLQTLWETLSGTPEEVWRPSLSPLLKGFYLYEGGPGKARIIYMEGEIPSELTFLVPIAERPELWVDQLLKGDDIWVDALLPSKSIKSLKDNTIKNYQTLSRLKPYDLKVLRHVRDFKLLVNLSYLVYLSKQMGVETDLDPVLSYPLGPNAISIMEATVAYQTIMTGKRFFMEQSPNSHYVPIITRLEDREGETLWEYKANVRELLDKTTSALLCDILRNVMVYGTGKRAKDQVKLKIRHQEMELAIPIPLFGKTGTANRFMNSSFVGFVPSPNPRSGKLSLEHGFVIGTYVGYDDNRPMESEHISVYGASGALPVWINTVNSIINSPKYKESLDVAELVFASSMEIPPAFGSLERVAVDQVTGLPINYITQKGPMVLSSIIKREDGSWAKRRLFRPLKEVKK